MARKPLRPLIRSGGFYPSRKWTPLVYAGGYTTANGGEEPAPPPIEKTVTGNPIHITDALAKPVQALSVKLEPVQAGSGDPSPDNVRPISGHTDADVTRTGKNLCNPAASRIAYRQSFVQGGVTVTYNADGSYRLQAETSTREDVGVYQTGNGFPLKLPAGTYTFSINGNEGYENYIHLCASGSGDDYNGAAYFDVTQKATVTVVDGSKPWNYVFFRIFAGGTFDVTLTIQVEAGNEATAYEEYRGTTYPIPLGNTVYGGTLDVLTGVLTVTMVGVDLGTLSWTHYPTYSTFLAYPAGIYPVDSSNYARGIKCSIYPSVNYWWSNSAKPDKSISHAGGNSIAVKDSSYSDAASFKTAMSGVQLCYELATPQTIQLTPTEVTLLLGENNLFSDGEMTLVYLADGNASDEEALNILLGGRYVNNHGEDEPSDREALDIVLGGKK